MRTALQESLAASRAGQTFDGYAKGSILICLSCAHPIYKLDASIGVGAKGSAIVKALRPVLPADLEDLAGRVDIDRGVVALCKALTPAQRRAYCEAIPVPRTGDPALCPRCHQSLVQGRTSEAADTRDRAFVIEPLFIPPRGQAGLAIRPGQVH